MADNETTSTTPVAPVSVAEPAPAEHTMPTVDPQPIMNVLQALSTDGPKVQPGTQPSPESPTPDGDRKPMGDISITP